MHRLLLSIPVSLMLGAGAPMLVHTSERNPVFVDVARKVGLNETLICGRKNVKGHIIETLGTGLALLDYNGDDNLDVFFVNGSTLEGFPPGEEPTNHLYRNDGAGQFVDVTEEAGLLKSGWGQGVCAGDYDNDGNIDLYVTYWGQNLLYRNQGDGTFADVTAKAGLIDNRKRWGAGCAFVDYDLDGNLDLFVANYVNFNLDTAPEPLSCRWRGIPVMCGPRGLKGETNQLFRNRGDGTFEEVSESSGVSTISSRYSMSVTTLDIQPDGWPDIYVAVDSLPSILFVNNQDGTFTDLGLASGTALSQDGREQAGMGSAAGDYNADGLLDLVKTNFSHDTPNLYRNDGDEVFTEVTLNAGLGVNTRFLGWGVAFLDFDNDSWPDIFMVNGHVYPGVDRHLSDTTYRQSRILYRNLGNGRFEDISQIAGPAVMDPHPGRGLAFGDYDNDGDVDLFISNIDEQPSLLRNQFSGEHQFISLHLIGTRSNRSAIGARVSVYTGDRVQVQEVRSGSSFMSHSDLRLHFGLSSKEVADRIEIEWPGGEKEVLQSVSGGHFYTVTEGQGITATKLPNSGLLESGN
ncbi:MAG TPA: CRTAC1 family protein [Acidobacteriota bacterium]|nr:CRTAC1 family protein [Acidobacteriota bacterium]